MQRSHTQYTKRNELGLEGFIEVEMEVVSDYLHVGSGVYDVELLKPIENIQKLVEEALKGNIPDLSGYFSPKTHEMVKYGDTPVIPGSTVKGLVRTRLELSIPDSCYIVSRRSNSTSRTYRRIFKNPQPKESDKFPKVCPVCDLLGNSGLARENSGLASRISFSDLIMTKGKTDFVKVYYGEYYESAVKGSKFYGKVLYKSLTKVDLGMLLYGLGFRNINGKLVGKVMLMGRFKYSNRRFGRVRFSLVTQKEEYAKALKEFVNKFNPRDFNEEW